MGTVSKEINGILYEAEYSVVDGIVTVYGDNGHTSTQLGGMKEESLAKILLSHLIREGKIDPAQ